MKLEEIKDEYKKEYSVKWLKYGSLPSHEKMINEIAKRYAQSKLNEALERVKESMRLNGSHPNGESWQKAITQTPLD